MKTTRYIVVLAFAAALASCDKQDDTYRQYVVNGGYNYPAKAADIAANAGYQKVAVSWATPLDPAVKTVKLYWDNYADSLAVSYADAVDGRLTATVEGLEERSYTFDVVNFDDSGNRSLASEITVSPYGDGWLSTHAERRIIGATMKGTEAVVSLGPAIDEMVYTKFRYKDADGNLVESDPVPVDSTTAYLANALKGKYYEYKSAYCPAGGLDVVWNENWNRAATPILYRMTPENWTITYTSKQVRSADYGPENMFDGDLETRYYSSTNTSLRRNFPKIVSINTNTEGDYRPTISSVNVIQHLTESKSRLVKNFYLYVGDEAYNPDDADYEISYGDVNLDVSLKQDSAEQSFSFNPATGSCIAIAFRSSYSGYGYIDVIEFEMYGYVKALAE